MKIHTLNTTPSTTAVTHFANLPDEAAVTLIADRSELAKVCSQPFMLNVFDWKKHQRGLCIGLTEGADAIGLFYIADNGLYAWMRIDRIYIPRTEPATRLDALSLTLGTTYWFTPSHRGDGYLKAESLGVSTGIRNRYELLHRPPVKIVVPASGKKRKSTDDDDDDGSGTPPVLHPQDGFTPLMSLDDLGL
jgi:hypothetical protein